MSNPSHAGGESEARRIRGHVRARYGALARAAMRGAMRGEQGCGCGAGQCCEAAPAGPPLSSARDYDPAELAGLPPGTTALSLGCGNPTALVDLLPGETVLDLGSGGGLDVLLSARRVGPTGKAYGLDLTEDMLRLARENLARSSLDNVEFLKGDMEAVPLPDDSVDVVISNCVLNLATDKDKAFREIHRVLRPGGRLAVTDIVYLGDVSLVPAWLRRSIDAWCGCVAGALAEDDYVARLEAAGLVEPSVTVIRTYDTASLPEGVRLASGFVRARKPAPRGGRVVLRPAEPGDLPAARRLLREAGLPVDGLEERFPGGFTAATAPGQAEPARAPAGEASGGPQPTGERPAATTPRAERAVLAGLAGLEVHGGHGLLRSLAVDGPWRGRGIGRRLVEDVLARARSLGLEAIWLLTTTAEGYFPRFGFVAVARDEAPAGIRASVEFARCCPATAALLRVRLG